MPRQDLPLVMTRMIRFDEVPDVVSDALRLPRNVRESNPGRNAKSPPTPADLKSIASTKEDMPKMSRNWDAWPHPMPDDNLNAKY